MGAAPDAFPNTRPGTGGNGSGGAILLRSLECVRVSGTIDATGGVAQTIGMPAAQLGGGTITLRARLSNRLVTTVGS